NYIGTWVASRGYEPVRRPNSAHQSMVPFQNFPSADGWLVVACPKQNLWQKLCEAIGRPELATDERYRGFGDRDRNRDELVPLLESIFLTRTTAEWLDALGPAGIPCAAVNDVAAALQDEQVAAREGIVESEHPTLGLVRQPAG